MFPNIAINQNFKCFVTQKHRGHLPIAVNEQDNSHKLVKNAYHVAPSHFILVCLPVVKGQWVGVGSCVKYT